MGVGMEADMEVDMEVDMAAAMEVDMAADTEGMLASVGAGGVGVAATPTSPADTIAADISTTAFAASVSGAAGSTPITVTAAGAGIPASTATWEFGSADRDSVREDVGGHQRVALPEGTPLV